MTTVTATNTLLRFAGGLFQIRLRPRNSNNRNTVTVTRGLAVGTPLKEGVPNQPVTGRYTSKAVTPSTICPPGPEASEAAKRAHEAYERALAKILRGATP